MSSNTRQTNGLNYSHCRGWFAGRYPPAVVMALAVVAVTLAILAPVSTAYAGWESTKAISGGGSWQDPAVAVKGPWAHVVWNRGDEGSLQYRRSRDGGRNFEAVQTLYTGSGIGEPAITAVGEDVHIVFRAYADKIYHIRSTDNGATFGTLSNLASTEGGYDPEVTACEDYVFVTWIAEDPVYDVIFRRSTNRGINWDGRVDLTTDNGATDEQFPQIACGCFNGPGATVMASWIENNGTTNYVKMRYSGSDAGVTWFGESTAYSETASWRNVGLTANGPKNFHFTRQSTTTAGPYHRLFDPWGGGWQGSWTSIGTGGSIGGMDGSNAYANYAATVYSDGTNIYTSTGPGTETYIGSGYDEDIAANHNGNMHVVYDASGTIYYKRYLALPRFFEDMGRPYNTDGLIESDAQWGDLDGDGDIDLVMCGEEEASGVRTTVVRNDNGLLENATYTSDWGVHSTGSGNLALGDYDNDGDLDLAMTGMTRFNGRVAYIYKNPGDGLFNWGSPDQQLTGVGASSVAWGDYDNDGDLDLYLQGHDGTSGVAKVYKNSPTGTLTEDTTQSLTPVWSGSADWGDWDADGDLDLVVTGNDGSNRRTIFYKNQPVGTLTDDGNHGVTVGIAMSDTAWGDFDNDADLDLLITGETSSGQVLSYVYANDSTGVLSLAHSVTGYYRSSCAWGDYDNDGDLDLAVCGYDKSWNYTEIYENTGSGFSYAFWFSGVREGSVSFADVENDGNLDFFVTGAGFSNDFYANLHENMGGELNTQADAPSTMSGSGASGMLKLSWGGAFDDETEEDGLYYALGVGPFGMFDGVHPSTYSTPLMGNVGEATDRTLCVPPGGPYFWKVRAVDAGLMASPWSDVLMTNVSGLKRPMPEDCATIGTGTTCSANGTCVTDDDCDFQSRCVAPPMCEPGPSVCYAPKGRYISIAAHPDQANNTARRLKLDDGTLIGWVGEPYLDPVGLWLVRVVGGAFYVNQWPDVVHVMGCKIAPNQTYEVQAIEQGSSTGDEDNFSEVLSLPTVPLWGDVVSTCMNYNCKPPQGEVNIDDILAEIAAFQSMNNNPLTWFDITPAQDDGFPDQEVNIDDILATIQGFQSKLYPGDGPLNCP